jgi:beta-1,4-N-acetylglucosaminyltransferase
MEAILTVGSTEFSSLVHAALDDAVLRALARRGCQRFTLQVGRSILPAPNSLGRFDDGPVPLLIVDFVPDIEARTAKASLVICHAGPFVHSLIEALPKMDSAGAGSVLAALCDGPTTKQIIVVPNTSLMDNHQLELAQELSSMGLVSACGDSSSDLARAIDALDGSESKRSFASGNAAFGRAVDKSMGYA